MAWPNGNAKQQAALPNDAAKEHCPTAQPNNNAQWCRQMALINHMSSGPPNVMAKSQTNNITVGNISEPIFKGFLLDGLIALPMTWSRQLLSYMNRPF